MVSLSFCTAQCVSLHIGWFSDLFTRFCVHALDVCSEFLINSTRLMIGGLFIFKRKGGCLISRYSCSVCSLPPFFFFFLLSQMCVVFCCFFITFQRTLISYVPGRLSDQDFILFVLFCFSFPFFLAFIAFKFVFCFIALTMILQYL